MHTIQPKHTKITSDEVEKILKKYNLSLTQLPKISKNDPALPENCEKGDIIKINRPDEVYYRVVI
ncbi:MAG: DNA-directed RNA polymerase subunit RpoH/Rpb5 C-terminal domain-containing protein [Nanoarchaeota archaeon]|nr:DNA-directed RNA polymerase subunit RpoH/Rpb5 C-terminal domain-containing protein [Nanoarchaeota archaeon]